MEQSKYWEEIDVWEHPPQPGIVLNEERNKKFFEENQTDSLLHTLFKMTQRGMMRKLKITSGLFIHTITWNPESKCTCRKKNHFLCQWSTSTLPEPLIRHWMHFWKNILMIIGTWMEKENYQMHGQASQDSFHWTKGHLTDVHGPGRDLRGNKQPQDPVWCSKKQSEAKVGYRETRAR